MVSEENKAKKKNASDDLKATKKGKRIIVKSLESLVEEEGVSIPTAATTQSNIGVGVANDGLALVVPTTERRDGSFPVGGAEDSPSEELLTFPSKNQVSTITLSYLYCYISLHGHAWLWYVDCQEFVSLLALDMAAVPLDRMC